MLTIAYKPSVREWSVLLANNYGENETQKYRAVESYKRPSDELLQKVTNVLQTPKSPIASGEK
jgi:hypothetical protein